MCAQCVKSQNMLRSTFTQFSLFYWPSVLHCTKKLSSRIMQCTGWLSLYIFRHTEFVFCLGKKIERAIEMERAFILCRWYPGLAHILWINATSITQYVLHDAWSGKRKSDYWNKELEVPSRFQRNMGIYCALIKKQDLTCILVFREIPFLFRYLYKV